MSVAGFNQMTINLLLNGQTLAQTRQGMIIKIQRSSLHNNASLGPRFDMRLVSSSHRHYYSLGHHQSFWLICRRFRNQRSISIFTSIVSFVANITTEKDEVEREIPVLTSLLRTIETNLTWGECGGCEDLFVLLIFHPVPSSIWKTTFKMVKNSS